jgi:hypothetical protein
VRGHLVRVVRVRVRVRVRARVGLGLGPAVRGHRGHDVRVGLHGEKRQRGDGNDRVVIGRDHEQRPPHLVRVRVRVRVEVRVRTLRPRVVAAAPRQRARRSSLRREGPSR